MKSSITKEHAGSLIPVLSEMDKQEMIAYYTVYEKYADEFSEKATEDLKDHPVFGKLIRDIPKEVSVARDKLSRKLQKDAIINDNWGPYIEYQIELGIAYAKMGLNFKSWYEVIVLVKNYIRPHLHQEYSGTELLSSLNGMNRFMDIAMCIIGEAYLQEKQEIIQDDRKKIKKLNQELEQKVIERTAQLESNIQKLNEYKHFFYNSNDFSCIANVEGYFEILNPNFEKLLGYSEKELLENQFLNFIHPDDIAGTLLEIGKLKSGALTINFVNRYRKKDSSYLWFDWNTTPDPVTGKLYAIARDITERKKAEDALELTQFAVDNFADAIFWITSDARIVKINEAVCSLLGYTRAEILQFTIPDIYPNYTAELWPNHFAELRQKGSLFFETYQQGKDGQLTPVEVRANYINFDNKEFNCATVRDISQRKKAEEQLQAVNKELESFSYSVSHDLRAPLRAINGYSTILQEDYAEKIDSEGLTALNSIKHNSKRMGALIDDLLAFSRLGRKEISMAEINMKALVKSIKDEDMSLNSSKIIFTIHDLLSATGDQSLIKQVWINLISNAIKYSKQRTKINIEIGSSIKNNSIEYFVKDNGAGFDMQYYNKLFGVFQRLHSQEEFEGTGIGLAIVQKVISRHNGTVWADSKVDEGATFYFSLPIR